MRQSMNEWRLLLAGNDKAFAAIFLQITGDGGYPFRQLTIKKRA
jgi:hypothetical protein